MTVETVNYGERYGWEVGVDFPEWGNTEAYVYTITKGYLYNNETPRDAYERVSKHIAKVLRKPELEEKFFNYIWNGWLCLASPVLSNVGAYVKPNKPRGLAISCYGVDIPDSIYGIGSKNLEMMLMAKNGGGVALNASNIRGAGAVIDGNGTSDGVVPFCKIYDSSILATNQGAVRRGAAVINLDIDHPDFMEWLEIREPTGDINRQSRNINQCAVISDDFMLRVKKGDKEARKRWQALLQKAITTGEPYIMWKDNVNRANPQAYLLNDLIVNSTNLCSEITLFCDALHSFVCCLSSVNLAKYDEWKDTDLVYTATWFLDGVMETFIQEAKKIKGMECAVRFSEKSRALGLGTLGWHTFLQQKGLPFTCFEASNWTNIIFSHIQEESDRASKDLAIEYGEPEWCKGTGKRNTHLRTIPPTVSNSKLSGNVSPGIEPWSANLFNEESAKGTFVRSNKQLEIILEKLGINTREIWNRILSSEGSVQELDELDNWWFNSKGELVHESNLEFNGVYTVKSVFATFKEINQLELVRQNAIRQPHVDQAISLNLRFPVGVKPKFVNKVHMEMWETGQKTRYYVRTESVLKAETLVNLTSTGCSACDG